MGPSQICGCPFREPRVFTIAHIYIYIIYLTSWFDYIHLYTKIQRYLWLWCWLWIGTIIYTHYFKLILAIPYPVDIKHHHSMFPVTCVSSQRFIRCYQTVSTFTTLSKLGPKQRMPTWNSRVAFFFGQATVKVSEFHATSVSAPFFATSGWCPSSAKVVYNPHELVRYGSVSKPCTPGEHQNSW